MTVHVPCDIDVHMHVMHMVTSLRKMRDLPMHLQHLTQVSFDVGRKTRTKHEACLPLECTAQHTEQWWQQDSMSCCISRRLHMCCVCSTDARRQ